MTKLDRKAAMRASVTAEKAAVDARFATADAVLAERPSGFAVPAPDQQAVHAPRTFSAERSDESDCYYVTVPLERVYDNPRNARDNYSPEVIKERAASLATHKQQVAAPATIHPTIPDAYQLIDGHYRKKGLALAGIATIDLRVQPYVSELDLYRKSWLANEERSAQTPMDNAVAWRKLLDDGLVSNESQIAELIGTSLPTVNKTLSMLNLPIQVFELMRDRPDKFGVSTGYELTLAAKTLDVTELTTLVHQIINDDLSSREVAAIRAKLETGGQRKRKETSRQYKISANQHQIGSLKEWDSGKVSLEIRLEDPKERAALVAELRLRFGIGD